MKENNFLSLLKVLENVLDLGIGFESLQEISKCSNVIENILHIHF